MPRQASDEKQQEWKDKRVVSDLNAKQLTFEEFKHLLLVTASACPADLLGRYP